jgi:hypothetical protein
VFQGIVSGRTAQFAVDKGGLLRVNGIGNIGLDEMEDGMKFNHIVASLAILAGMAGLVSADVAVKSTIENQGVGGIMNMQGNQQIMVSGDRAKTVSQMKMTNKVVKFLGGGKPQENAEITRLDKELFWHLNPKDKEYTELTFAEMKAQFEKGLQECGWSRPVKVRR